MADATITAPVKRPRLKFIDMARSIAILLMLEGHFIDATLGTNFRSEEQWANPDFLAYDIWLEIRGYTSPMFLTMTGMVFVYLLYMNRQSGFFQNQRVKKGFRRVLELLFWGYFLNPKGFHILQCIGYGILGLLLVYGLYKLTKVIPLWVYYFVISLLIFSCYAPLSQLKVDGVRIGWPYGYPEFIQNMFSSPKTLFPLAPNLAYTFFGAGIGVLLHQNWLRNFKWNISIFLATLGAIFAFYSYDILEFLHYKFLYFFGFGIENLLKANWLFEIQGWVLMILGLLATLEKIITIPDGLFLKIGQNTLSIFVVHMMILYGAVIHIGINDFFSAKYNPLNQYEAAIGAALFITLFVVMIYYLEQLTAFMHKVLDFIFPFRKRFRK